MFTNTDKALLDRAARRATASAACLKSLHPSWGASKDSKKAKLEYDRLMRDAHDTRNLAKRMVPPKLKAMPSKTLELGDIQAGGTGGHQKEIGNLTDANV